ncbi:hypothetical protein [Pseudoclavibacter helvolus]|uniref:hypothetical protein n=1 Tax=Pseudoclavibacter helvolus TaxID=255205 RepID=UPI003C726D4C
MMERRLASVAHVAQHLQRVDPIVRRASTTHFNPRAAELADEWCGEVDSLALGGQLSSTFNLLSEDVIGLLATASPGKPRPEFLFAALDVSMRLGRSTARLANPPRWRSSAGDLAA